MTVPRRVQAKHTDRLSQPGGEAGGRIRWASAAGLARAVALRTVGYSGLQWFQRRVTVDFSGLGPCALAA